MDDDALGCVLVIVVVATIFFAGYTIGRIHGERAGYEQCQETFRETLIKKDLAEYDSVTGEWKWKKKDE